MHSHGFGSCSYLLLWLRLLRWLLSVSPFPRKNQSHKCQQRLTHTHKTSTPSATNVLLWHKRVSHQNLLLTVWVTNDYWRLVLLDPTQGRTQPRPQPALLVHCLGAWGAKLSKHWRVTTTEALSLTMLRQMWTQMLQASCFHKKCTLHSQSVTNVMN